MPQFEICHLAIPSVV